MFETKYSESWKNACHIPRFILCICCQIPHSLLLTLYTGGWAYVMVYSLTRPTSFLFLNMPYSLITLICHSLFYPSYPIISLFHLVPSVSLFYLVPIVSLIYLIPYRLIYLVPYCQHKFTLFLKPSSASAVRSTTPSSRLGMYAMFRSLRLAFFTGVFSTTTACSWGGLTSSSPTFCQDS